MGSSEHSALIGMTLMQLQHTWERDGPQALRPTLSCSQYQRGYDRQDDPDPLGYCRSNKELVRASPPTVP